MTAASALEMKRAPCFVIECVTHSSHGSLQDRHALCTMSSILLSLVHLGRLYCPLELQPMVRNRSIVQCGGLLCPMYGQLCLSCIITDPSGPSEGSEPMEYLMVR